MHYFKHPGVNRAVVDTRQNHETLYLSAADSPSARVTAWCRTSWPTLGVPPARQ